MKRIFNQSEALNPDLDSDTSSVRNFCARSSKLLFARKPVDGVAKCGCIPRVKVHYKYNHSKFTGLMRFSLPRENRGWFNKTFTSVIYKCSY